MKYLLYVTLAVLLWSAECKVIRQIGNDIDKPSSNRVIKCPGGCESPTVDPDLDNEPQTSESHLPSSPSENEVLGQDIEENKVLGQDTEKNEVLGQDTEKNEVLGQDTEKNKVIREAGQQHQKVVHDELKRDIGSLFPIGGKFISDAVNKGEDFLGVFVPKFGKMNFGRRRRLVPNGHGLGERFGATLLTPFV